ncbi:DUF349 domain-containing protein [Floccifex sp.]|uniref:DUF349 domain-containing protein n=1 Tax=Floccifex sp. TaxID=2815810 RepID=UPI002A764C94|nr:DUF349 domain-containing protein [Floccifex sp.]MDD7280661.1 DUF349 domain-containing protein [Erysipelotrichaceae bacterium]MDY2958904.1 DUF349 domain-containing protein [Floccifex sp.]
MAVDYNDEMFEEQDLGADINAKEALIQEAESLKDEENWNEANRKANQLKKRWRKIPFYESLQEEDLRERFEKALDVVYEKRNELYKKAQEVKSDLVKQAKELSVSTEWNKTTQKLNDLMDQWKQAGSAGDKDDELWEEFNDARQTFYNRKRENWEELNKKFESARQVKENLVEQAKSLQDSEQWKKTSQKLNDLMDQWKQAGNAGKEYEQALWNDFNAARQVFYDRRNAFYEDLHKKQDINYEQKMALVNQAKQIVNTNEFTKENTETMKELSNEWKKIGSCGKEKENTIWKEFRGVNDQYFDGLTKFNEQKHLDWVKRMTETRDYKKSQIENQKRQIARLQEDTMGLVSEEQIRSIEAQIADKEDFIKKLEDEVADIDKKIAE